MLIRVRNIYLSFAFKYINDIRSIIIVVDNTGIKGNFSSRRVETICCGTRSREKKREREKWRRLRFIMKNAVADLFHTYL